MREILFRGKRLDNDEWVEGLITHDIDGTLSSMEVYSGYCLSAFYDVDPSTVSQYTGLNDKNGKRIFEGDIVTGMIHGPNAWTGQVIWLDRIAGFGLKWIHREDPTALENCTLLRFLTSIGKHPDEYLAEVIGNIYDNPELTL